MAGLALNLKLTADGSNLAGVASQSEKEVQKLGRASQKAKDDLNGLDAAAKNSGSSIASSFREIGGIIAGYMTFDFAKSFVSNTLESAKAAENYAAALGMSTQAIQEWQFAGQSAGLQADKVADILKDVSDKIGDFATTGAGEAVDIFERLNLDIAEFVKLSPDKALLRMADAMDKADITQSERVFLFEAIANDVSLLEPLLKNNAELLKEFGKQANETGNVLSNMDMSTLKQANSLLSELSAEIKGNATQSVVYLAEIFVESFRPISAIWIDVKGGMIKMLEVVDFYFESMKLVAMDIWDDIRSLILSKLGSIATEAAGALGNIPGLSSLSESIAGIGDSLAKSSAQSIDYRKESEKLESQHKNLMDSIDAMIEADKDAELGKTANSAANVELSNTTGKYTGSLKQLKESQDAAKKSADELAKKQGDFNKQLKEQIATFGMSSAESRRWKAEQDGLLTAENDAQLKKLEYLEFEKEQKNDIAELQREMYEEEKRNIEDLWELDKKRSEDWQRRREASGGFKEAFVGGLGTGSASGLLGSISDFMGGSGGADLKFGDLLGEYGFGGFGDSVDKFIGGIGGMEKAAGYLGGFATILGGGSENAMKGIGQIAGSYFGPLGAQLGGMLGGALSGLGIGGSTPYEAKGFAASGSLFDGINLAALASNNKNDNRDVLNTEAGTFGKWNISDVLSGNQSLGQGQLKTLIGVNETIQEFKKGLVEYVGDIGDLFGNDLVEQFKTSFDAGISIEGENFEQAFTQWIAETGKSAIEWAKENIDTSKLDEAGKLLFEIGSAFDFNADVMKTAKQSIDNVSEVFNMLEIDSSNLNSALVAAAGGLAGLQSSLNFFYSEFTSDDEKLADQTDKAREALKELGAEMPRSRAEFNNLYKNDKDFISKLSEEQLRSIDTVYDAQEKQAADATREQERMMQQQTRAYDSAGSAHDNYIDSLMKGADSLNEWIMQQLIGKDSATTFSEQFALAQGEFNRLASMGTNADPKDIQNAADTLLRLNREGYGARGAGLEAQVLNQVQGIANGINPSGGNEAVIALLGQLLEATREGNDDNSRQLRRMNDTRRRA